MSAAVEVGARSTRKGARLHPAGGCGWSSLPLVGQLVTLNTRNAHRTCKSVACRKAIRTAIDALRTLASRAQGYGRAVAHQTRVALDILAETFAAPVKLSTAGYNAEYDAERAEIAARWAAHNAPVETVPEISKLGQFAASLGVVPNQSQPITVTRKSQRGRLALANSFAHAA